MYPSCYRPRGWCIKSAVCVQAVSVMANLLLDALRNTRTSPAEATDACKHLLQLQAEGSPCMEHCDPIQLYLTTQVTDPFKCGRYLTPHISCNIV